MPQNQIVLSLFANGLNTGLVVDSGAQITYVAPVFEGYCILNDIETVQAGGSNIDLKLQALLK